jgi:hypothetical protein
MKKITLLLVCLIGLTGFVQAQELQSSSQLGDLLNRLNQVQDYAGGVSDFFTPQEQSILHDYFISIRNNGATTATVNYEMPFGASSFGEFVSTETHTINLPQGTVSAVTGQQNSPTAIVTYTDRTAFEAAYSGTLVNEDFSGGPGAGTILACGPIMSSAGDGCFPAGELEDGFNVTASSGGDTIYIGAGAIGNTSTLVGANTFADFTLLNFAPDGAYAVGADLFVDTANDADIRVYDTGGILMDTFTVTNTPNTENFFGFISDDPIGHIEYQAATDSGELFGNLAFGTDANGGGGGSGIAYAIENASAMYGTFDPTDPSVFNPIAASGVGSANFENAGAVDPTDSNNIYVLDNANNMFSVDATTGAYTSMGTVTAPGGEGWVAMEFDPTDGTLYGLSGTISASATLSVIDPIGMTATPVGGPGAVGMTGAIALAIDGNGIVYAHDLVDDAIYTIDKTTGVGTFLGATGFDANYGQGMAYDPATDTIFLTAFNNALFDSELRTMDPATGATTLVGQMEPSGLTQYGWSSFEAGTVGVGENTLEGFSFSPNPTSGIISLKSVNSIDSVSIYNLLGQQVFSTAVDATSADISLSSLSTGTYIMKVSVEGQIGTYKILKN